MINPRQHKTTICGLQGGGKTYLAKEIVKENNMKVLVFSPHWHDFDKEGDCFYFYEPYSLTPETVEKFWGQAIALCKAGVIDGVLIDEYDMMFQNNFMIGTNAIDAFSNHRHYNMAIIGITRRPQDIPTKYFEACKYIISFCLQGENARQKFNGMYKGMGDQITSLDYESHSYVLKQIGKPPTVEKKA